MDITEVSIRLAGPRVRSDGTIDDRLLAYATVVFDDWFCVKDLKVVRDGSGKLFVGMPSRKIDLPCPRCATPCWVRSQYCPKCGRYQGGCRAELDADGKAILHADVVHPINHECRAMIHDRVFEAYWDAVEDEGRAQGVVASAGPLAGRVRAGEVA